MDEPRAKRRLNDGAEIPAENEVDGGCATHIRLYVSKRKGFQEESKKRVVLYLFEIS